MAPRTIYVFLPEENTPVWAPMGAEHVGGDVYRILDDLGEEEAQFRNGDLVKCQPRILEGGVWHLVAVELSK